MGFISLLGPPVVPFYPFFGGRGPTKIDYRKKGTLILASLLEDLASMGGFVWWFRLGFEPLVLAEG